jgi:nicotinamide-nucleotide amidase
VLGAKRVRAVDPTWPAVGARFHHTVGAPTVDLDDSTKILELVVDRRVVLEARFRPFGTAVVTIELDPLDGGRTRITMSEAPRSGPIGEWWSKPLVAMTRVRNTISLRRLARLAEQRGVNVAVTPDVERVARLLAGRTLACAESCTGGLVAQRFAATPGSMEWFTGGVVTYQRRAKAALLGIPPAPLVSAEVAEAMAGGAARLFGTEVAVSVTGAAGPEPLDGADPGTVIVGTRVDGVARSFEHHFEGSPEEVCLQARDAVIADLAHVLEAKGPEPRRRAFG